MPEWKVYRPTALTSRQVAIVAAINKFVAVHGRPPSVRELAAATGGSRSRIHEQLNYLRFKGAITGVGPDLRVVR